MNISKFSGFSLLEVIVSTAIASVVMLGSSTLMLQLNKSEKDQEKSFYLLSLRQELQNKIVSNNGWSSIAVLNPEVNCIQNPTSCTNINILKPLKIPLRNVTLDSTLDNLGMGPSGEICNSFDPVNGDNNCPYGININWMTVCQSNPCKNPQPKVVITFQEKAANGVLKKLDSFNLIIYKDPKLESLNEVCQSMGGVLVGNVCSLNSLASNCDPSNSLGFGPSFPLGFDANGGLICGLPNPGGCSPSDVAVGFDINGSVQCSPACH